MSGFSRFVFVLTSLAGIGSYDMIYVRQDICPPDIWLYGGEKSGRKIRFSGLSADVSLAGDVFTASHEF